ncbi:GGDEF domain-containing protein [Pseudomaricurvus alkylphenolicus]|jgi:diguanylate cyclase (GGDEF)-like protein|uniref:sensor domain-containing diguanylate cyclase n=1 Tax=Pseudomaricurvus alkylphenolicus TaxID=1306991 RepID=UPI00141E4898|nr:sensor domain-containing diguanylate cyclase [Pseudomaricurvus alkylphenolicus]NIB39270.1 GGDEF domain-containing protein [Pseudomaricurvus alkylphenolicus]
MPRKTFFIIAVCAVLVVGFGTTSLVSYFVANSALSRHIQTNSLPITSDNIYSEIQRDLLQPILVSSLMAQDTFVRDWVIEGEQGAEAMVRYLQSIQNRYDTITAFFISDVTRQYYHSSGVLKQVDRDNPLDQWYFRVSAMQSEFEINLDVDTADSSRTTLFVNHKVYDYKGDYLGAIGVGLASSAISDRIEAYRMRYGRDVYFADRQGNIVLHGAEYDTRDNIRQIPGLRDLATNILTNPSGSFEYRRKGREVFLQSRYVPQLDWYLLVEEERHGDSNVIQALWLNLGLSLVITVVVIVLVYFSIRGYQQKLERMATTDALTGTTSRHAFDPVLEQMLQLSVRRNLPLSVLMVDVDLFKQVNDIHGHLMGDRVLKEVARLLNEQLRRSDAICRWGGEEFLIALPECDIESASTLAERMRHNISESLQVVDGKILNITASFGAAQFNLQESADNLFARADSALYRAKEAGRNNVVCARPLASTTEAT